MESRQDTHHSVNAGEYESDGQIPFQAMFEDLKPQLALADRKLRRIVRKNPFASLAVVTLAGFVLGRLLRSR